MKSVSKSSLKSNLRSLALGVAVLGLTSVLGGQALLTNSSVAYAEPVRVEGQQIVGFADVVEQVSPAVVSVRVKSDVTATAFNQRNSNPFEFLPGFRDLPKDHPFNQFFRDFGERRSAPKDNEKNKNKDGRQQRRFTSQGSGFFISEDGLIVTNNHVIDKGAEFFVTMHDGSELEAELIGKDRRTDLALLKVKKEGKYTHVKFSDNDSRVGEWVVAVGNPFGLGGTVTAGIISARGRDVGAENFNDFIQIDAAVNKGNSGGPAFNLNGEVVGINTAIYSPSGGNVGIAFAIPAATAKIVIEDLKDNGKVVRGFLGVGIQDITRDIADSIGLADTSGALVSQTHEDTPAAKAGIKPSDAIVAIDGKKIESSLDLKRHIAGLRPDTEVDVTVFRNGETKNLVVKLGTLPEERRTAKLEAPKQPEAPTTMEEFGLELKTADDGKGVVITQIKPNSVLAEKGLRNGNKVVDIDGAEVNTPDAMKEAIKKARKNGKKAVLLRVESRAGTRFVAMPLTKKG